jgi:hypothetical protein
MKQEITIEAVIGPGSLLLMEVARALPIMAQPPPALVWSTITGSTEARIWMVLDDEEAKLAALCAVFQKLTGVQRVVRRTPQHWMETSAGYAR